MRTFLLFFVVCVALALSGCVPFPHSVTLIPELSGTVTESGVPLSNVNVYLSGGQNNPCKEPTEIAQTANHDGSFKFERVSRFNLLYAPLVAPISVSEFTLCISTPTQTFLGFRGVTRSYGTSEALLVSCDTMRPRTLNNRVGVKEERVCELVKAKRQ